MPSNGIEPEPDTNRALIGTCLELPSIDLRSRPCDEEGKLILTRKRDERFKSNQSNSEWIGCLIPLAWTVLLRWSVGLRRGRYCTSAA
jgi:hypothetical protein